MKSSCFSEIIAIGSYSLPEKCRPQIDILIMSKLISKIKFGCLLIYLMLTYTISPIIKQQKT